MTSHLYRYYEHLSWRNFFIHWIFSICQNYINFFVLNSLNFFYVSEKNGDDEAPINYDNIPGVYIPSVFCFVITISCDEIITIVIILLYPVLM